MIPFRREKEKVFKSFVSHKHEDHDLAIDVKRALEDLSGETNQIECFVSGEDIQGGTDWKQLIREELRDSHLLLLLFTNPTKEWDWCLYEAGLFTRFSAEKVKGVVCLYNPRTKPPSQLANLQGIPVKRDKTTHFLRNLCRNPTKYSDTWKSGPLNREIKDHKLESAARALCRGFEHSMPYHPCHRIVLDLRCVKDPIGEFIPDDARVIEDEGFTSAFTLSLFGIARGPKSLTWGELVKSIGGEDAPWRRQLDIAFAAARREELFDPVDTALLTWDKKRTFHPILYRMLRVQKLETDICPSNPMEFEPVQLTIVLERAVERTTDPVFSLLRMHEQFRREVFDNFVVGHVKKVFLFNDTKEAIRDEILDPIRRIESGSSDYKLFESGECHEAYGETAEQFEKQIKKWMDARARLDQALSDSSQRGTIESLDELQRLNHQRLKKVTNQYLKTLRQTAATRSNGSRTESVRA